MQAHIVMVERPRTVLRYRYIASKIAYNGRDVGERVEEEFTVGFVDQAIEQAYCLAAARLRPWTGEGIRVEVLECPERRAPLPGEQELSLG